MLGFIAMTGPRREIWFVAALFLASSGTVQQYLGLAGVAAYLVGLAIVVPLADRIALPWLRRRVDDNQALLLAGATLVGLVVVLAVVYPHANVHTPSSGSDRDDAANIGTSHLFHLHYPYSTPTYLGNMISQLPGAFVLDAPFVALGSSAYQNVLWLAVLFLLLRWWARDARAALFAVWLTLALSPALLREYLNGGDVIANAVAMLAFMVGAMHLRASWMRFACAIGLGLALAWRPNVWYWLPLFTAAVWRRDGLRRAFELTACSIAVSAALILPFYIPHRHDFAPLLTLRKVKRYGDVVPHSSVVILGATAIVTLWLAWIGLRRVSAFFADLAVVQALLIGFVVVLASVDAGKPDFSTLVLAYGLFFLLPLLFAFVEPTYRDSDSD